MGLFIDKWSIAFEIPYLINFKRSADKYLEFWSLCLLFILPIDCRPPLATDQLSHARHFKRALSELHLVAFSMFSALFTTDFLLEGAAAGI